MPAPTPLPCCGTEPTVRTEVRVEQTAYWRAGKTVTIIQCPVCGRTEETSIYDTGGFSAAFEWWNRQINRLKQTAPVSPEAVANQT